MACCDHDEHDYCCRCHENDAERVHQIIEDILDGSYDGDVAMFPTHAHLPYAAASSFASDIVKVLQHEDVI